VRVAHRHWDAGDIKPITDWELARAGERLIKSEVRQEIVKRIAVEARTAVERQEQLVAEALNSERAAKQAEIILHILENAFDNARRAVALLETQLPPTCNSGFRIKYR
jgi:hypothetical protein